MSIKDQLIEITGLKPKKGEIDDSFAKRCVDWMYSEDKKGNPNLDDDAFDEFSDELAEWLEEFVAAEKSTPDGGKPDYPSIDEDNPEEDSKEEEPEEDSEEKEEEPPKKTKMKAKKGLQMKKKSAPPPKKPEKKKAAPSSVTKEKAKKPEKKSVPKKRLPRIVACCKALAGIKAGSSVSLEDLVSEADEIYTGVGGRSNLRESEFYLKNLLSILQLDEGDCFQMDFSISSDKREISKAKVK